MLIESVDNDDTLYKASVDRQIKSSKNYDTLRNYNSIPIGSTVPVQWEDG